METLERLYRLVVTLSMLGIFIFIIWNGIEVRLGKEDNPIYFRYEVKPISEMFHSSLRVKE